MEVLDEIVSSEPGLKNVLERNKEYCSFREEEKRYKRLWDAMVCMGAGSVGAFFALNPYEFSDIDFFLCATAAAGIIGSTAYGIKHLRAHDRKLTLQMCCIHDFYGDQRTIETKR